ncbi:MAG TPA: hypothetical protein VGB37_14715 [Candidatus Lokiarchaeia archaeon]
MKTKKELNNFEEFEFENKHFKIYTWENKKFGDLILNLPENERLATFQKFVKAINSGRFKIEQNKIYITKHFSKLQWSKKYCLTGLYLDRNLGLLSYSEGLESSYDLGRVVVIIEK